jgi:hypothetical protein
MVDPEDYERLNKYKWHLWFGRGTCYVQWVVKINGMWTTVMMHRDIQNKRPMQKKGLNMDRSPPSVGITLCGFVV